MRRLIGVCLALLLLASGVPQVFAQPGGNGNRLIVVFKPGVSVDDQASVVRSHGAAPLKPLRLINATVVTVPDAAARARLSSDQSVVRVDDDLIVTAIEKPTTTGKGKPRQNQPTQTLPWGIDRIDAELAWSTTTGTGINVAIIDTGIDLDHPDLAASIKGGVNTIKLGSSYNDDNGHGTHVAGTVAAINNAVGVVGGAPSVGLYGIKVLDRNGSGYLSDVIEGLDWAITFKVNVLNMSLGSSSGNQSFHDAVIRAYRAGITLVAAAGNHQYWQSTAVSYPAAYPEVIAVTALDSNNALASFSNYGSQVDLAAPGVSINSTYNNGSYTTLSGTSMASPHVAASAALVIAAGKASTPDGVSARLKATATNVGLSASQQGAGMVSAYAAVTK